MTESLLSEAPPIEEFEEYRVLRPLGHGAMGQVYVAHDTLLDRLVAIKFIGHGEPSQSVRERFYVEARAIARLAHPNVVTVFRVGEVRGRPYLVSELVRGQPLDRVPKPAPWRRVLELGIGLSRGLAAAHRRGVLHRDLKPANAIEAEDGEVKLLDFGLAKLLDLGGVESEAPTAPLGLRSREAVGSLDATISLAGGPSDLEATVPPPGAPGPSSESTTGIVGSPLYMAPELWRGEVATRRSDVYSLGVLLYELACGRAPHRGALVGELPRLRQEVDAEPLARVAPDVDGALARVIDRCLARDPAARFDSGDALREALEALEARAPAKDAPEGNPYRGLQAFEAEHRAVFFGRDAEVRGVLARLRSEAFVLVAGDSGVGKSSLCRAGVLPRVADGALGGTRWHVLVMLPGRRPVAALVAAVAGPLGLDEDALARELRADASALLRALRRQTSAAGVVLFIDQLEELVTLSDPAEAQQLGEILSHVSAGVSGVRVLASARGDFLTRLAMQRPLGDELGRALHILRPLEPDAMREAITGPAIAKGVRFESERLVDELLSSTARAEGGLPLLQFALAELWERRDRTGGVITPSALTALGGVAGALARHADTVLERMLPVERRAARRVLTSLVTVDGTRARRSEAELGAGEPSARAAIAALVLGRLLVARGGDEATSYEMAHEALITGWGTLRGWLDAQAESRAARHRLELAAAEWTRLDRAPEALWSDRQLGEIATLDDLQPALIEFVAQSRRIVRRRRVRRVGLLLGASLGVVLIYSAVRLEARWRLDARIATHVGEADRALLDARARDRELGAARLHAYAAFDGKQVEQGEKEWTAALALARDAGEAYGKASRALEAALLLDAGRDDLRGRLGELIYERLLAASRDLRGAEQQELLQRLPLYDREGTLRARLDEPARLTLSVEPREAQVSIDRYDGVGRSAPLGAPAPFASPGYLGVTRLPPGSYLLSATHPDRAAVRYPVVLHAGQALDLRLALPRHEQVPPGFAYVPPGEFLFGSGDDEDLRRTYFQTAPVHGVRTPGYLIGQHEVTFEEWLEFLGSLPAGERARRSPRPAASVDAFASMLRLTEERGVWRLILQPTARAYSARAGEPIRYAERTQRAAQDWRRFPVSAISPDDAVAYTEWLARVRLPGARLCTELEWERGARGADGRRYPHGNRLEDDDANFDATYGRKEAAFGPDQVGSHPTSESPFGLADMAGNVWELTSSSLVADQLVIRGGSWYTDAFSARSVNRQPVDRAFRHVLAGFRVCASARW